MNNAKSILKKYFGYDNFRLGQEEIIKNILDKKDVLGIMPTGAGKSISCNNFRWNNNCYFSPNFLNEGSSR